MSAAVQRAFPLLDLTRVCIASRGAVADGKLLLRKSHVDRRVPLLHHAVCIGIHTSKMGLRLHVWQLWSILILVLRSLVHHIWGCEVLMLRRPGKIPRIVRLLIVLRHVRNGVVHHSRGWWQVELC